MFSDLAAPPQDLSCGPLPSALPALPSRFFFQILLWQNDRYLGCIGQAISVDRSCVVNLLSHFTTNSSMFRTLFHTSYLTSVFFVFGCVILGDIEKQQYNRNKKAQLTMTNPSDAKACRKLLQFDVKASCRQTNDLLEVMQQPSAPSGEWYWRILLEIACFPTPHLFDAPNRLNALRYQRKRWKVHLMGCNSVADITGLFSFV